MNDKAKIFPCILKGDEDFPPEIPLYRYLSTESFLYLLEFERLMFSKISEWPDSFEGTRYEFLKRARDDKEFSETQKDDLLVAGHCRPKRAAFIRMHQCLISAQKELALHGSAAMWESYCRNGGVRIKTTLGKVQQLFQDKLPGWNIYRGKVYYEPADNWTMTLQTPSLVSTLLHKRVSFRSESEYRFVLLPNAKVSEPRETVTIDDLYDFLDEILISPATSSNVWLSRTLYNIAVGITIKPPKRTCINWKDGKQFCRISQLYKHISETVGHCSMT